MRIASYNIRKARGLDQRRDPRRIISVVNGLNAQIVMLQEADRRLGNRPAALSRELIETETDFHVVPVSTSDDSVGWHGNAVLLHNSIDTQSISRIKLPGLEPRGADRVDRSDGPVLVATHLGLLRRHRRKQLATIIKSLSDAPSAIIAGDFNEWRSDRGLEALDERFEVVSPGLSFHAARPLAGFDRIAFTRDLVLGDAGVEQSALARRASDHLPVWADLQL